MEYKPTVTVAIPALNEEAHIAKVIDSFQKNTYSNISEIIVADGGSTDRTKEIVNNISVRDPRVRCIENPGKIQSIGLNLILEQTKSDLFLRADAHTVYAIDYVERCVEAHRKNPNVINVGGAQRFIYKNSVQAGIALASVSFFGSGGAKYRNPNYSGFVDTVYLGCFKTKYLKKIGGYKPIAINEDFDLNFKLAQISKHAIYLSKDIKAYYYPRDSFFKLMKQYYKYGRFKKATSDEHHSWSLRSLLPVLGVVINILIEIILLLYVGSLTGILYLLSVVLIVQIDLWLCSSTFKQNNNLSRLGISKSAEFFFNGILAVILQNLSFAFGYLTSYVRKVQQ